MISLCIPTFNRVEMVIESFSNVLNDDRISEIIICDDCSRIDIYNNLTNLLLKIGSTKIKIFRNEVNKGSFYNKLESVKKASNDWIILLDSDNQIMIDYLNSIPNELDINTMYIPSHAICNSTNLNYTKYSSMIFNKDEYKILSKSSDTQTICMLNTGNYFFNKNTYLKSILMESNIINSYALDAYYMIYLLYKNIINFRLNVVDGMKYHHYLHSNTENSHYMKNAEDSSRLSIEINKMIDLI